MLLNSKAMALIRARVNEGKSHKIVASELTAMGYRTVTGLDIDNKAVSAFAIKNGIKIKTMSKRTIYKSKNSEVDKVALAQLVLQHLPSDKALQVLKAML